MAACGERVSPEWLVEHMGIAIAEYENVWMNPATRLTEIGLNRYFGEGHGRPKETEPAPFRFRAAKICRQARPACARIRAPLR